MERKDVLRSKRLIEEAYFDLIVENNEKITVNSIIERAGVSRSTFYAHYQDIPQLDESIENRIISFINSLAANVSTKELINDPRATFKPMLQAMFTRKYLLRPLIVSGWKPLVFQKIRDAFDNLIHWDELGNINRQFVEAVNNCIKGILLETCYYYAMSDEEVNTDLLIDTTCTFIEGAMSNIVKKYL